MKSAEIRISKLTLWNANSKGERERERESTLSAGIMKLISDSHYVYEVNAITGINLFESSNRHYRPNTVGLDFSNQFRRYFSTVFVQPWIYQGKKLLLHPEIRFHQLHKLSSGC